MNQAQPVEEYLAKLFEIQPFVPDPKQKRQIENDLSRFIVDQLSRKKFRRRRLSPQTKQAISQKVEKSIQQNIPIHLVVPFGGYKHFWNKSHPNPDWAELFNFKYLTDYVQAILNTYNPGVIIEYISEDLILNKMDNYPPESLEEYSKNFTELIQWYNQKTPQNLSFEFFRVKDKCNSEDLIKKVESMLPERRKSFEKLTQEQKDQELHRSQRALMIHGDKDLSKLNQDELEQRIIDSRLIELAYYYAESQPEFLGEYLWEKNHICVCFSFGTTHDNDEFQDLTLGSTYGSLVDHWIGRGILVETKKGIRPRIVSKKQYQEFQDKLLVYEVSNRPDHQNFEKIELLPCC